MTPHRWIVSVTLTVAAVILVVQVLIPPVVGLANNGDFEKVMAPAGLDFLTKEYGEQNWRWALTRFALVPPHPSRSGALYSEILMAKLAVGISRVMNPRSPVWDIRVLGALHALLLLVAFGMILAGCRDLRIRTQIVVAVLLVFFFTDVGYVSVFNSLYGQTTSLLFLLLLAGATALAVRRGRLDGGLLAVYFVCAVLFVSSKPQECIHGTLLGLLAIVLARVRFRDFWRRWATYLAAGLVGFSAWYYYAAIPQFDIREVARYHTVFMELLPRSPDPAADLVELGLDPAWVKYSGIHAYLPTSPIGLPDFKKRFFDNFGYRKLLVFYAKHPPRFYDRMTRAGRRAFLLRPPGLGNFEQATGKAPFAVSRRFALWSDLRAKLQRAGLLGIALLFSGVLYASVRRYGRASPRARLFRVALIALTAMATLEFLVCSLADYLGDLSRHLFTFHAMFDMILIAAIAWPVEAAARRRPAQETAA
jgi:hypothetical protein